MEIKHVGHRGTSLDPAGDAIGLLPRAIEGRTAENPLTPAAFWAILKDQGFYFMHPGADGRLRRLSDAEPAFGEWGTFFAGMILEHAAGRQLIAGTPAERRFWKRG